MKKKEILIDEETLQERIQELAEQINEDYKGKELTVICILKGAMYFFTDLTKKLNMDTNIEIMKVSSYIGENSTGKINVRLDLEHSIQGKDVLVVEDIVDSGKTMEFLLDYLALKNPNSIKICTLLDKKERREVDNLKIDYIGFSIPNHFVIGYGLDLDEKYRNLKEINCFINESDEEKLNKDVKAIKKQLKK